MIDNPLLDITPSLAGAAHKFVRALTKHYPTRRLAPQFSGLVGAILPIPDPPWMVSEPCGKAPRLELNLSIPHQRKIFYFPTAWGNYWMNEPFPRFMQQELSPGGVFVDIGAHLGFFSFFAAGLLGREGAVGAFEPDPDTYESLSRSTRFQTGSSVTCVNVAVSDAKRTAQFYRAWKPASSSLVSEGTGPDDRYRDSVQVDCDLLDDCLAKLDLDLDRLQLIKCDVEGHEVEAVSGMTRTLEAAAYPPLWIEVRGPDGSRRAPNTYPEVKRLLSGLGYRPYFWREGQEVPVSDGDVRGREDVLFRH